MLRRSFLAWAALVYRDPGERRPFPRAEIKGELTRVGQTAQICLSGGNPPYEIRVILDGNFELLASEVARYFEVTADPGETADSVMIVLTARKAFRGVVRVLDEAGHEYSLALRVV
jgi:hypothetical protein